MKWFRIYGAALLLSPKWLVLSMEARGGWVTLMALASAMEPPGRFGSLDHAVRLLAREGAEKPEELLARLIECRLVDRLDNGSIELHDWADWQARYPSDEPQATRERQRRSRATRAATGNQSPLLPSHEHVTRSHEQRETDGKRKTEEETPRPHFDPLRVMTDAGLKPELQAVFHAGRDQPPTM